MEQKKQIRCLLRNAWVAALPEETMRQKLVHQIVHQLGYPKSSLSVEISLHQLPHLEGSIPSLPQRRTDLICFAKGIHPEWDLYPLLVVECKAVKLTDKCMAQLIGYNHFLNAYFVALANEDELRFGWRKNGEYQFINRLPSYRELMDFVKKERL